jgi:hypothetical protein
LLRKIIAPWFIFVIANGMRDGGHYVKVILGNPLRPTWQFRERAAFALAVVGPSKWQTAHAGNLFCCRERANSAVRPEIVNAAVAPFYVPSRQRRRAATVAVRYSLD